VLQSPETQKRQLCFYTPQTERTVGFTYPTVCDFSTHVHTETKWGQTSIWNKLQMPRMLTYFNLYSGCSKVYTMISSKEIHARNSNQDSKFYKPITREQKTSKEKRIKGTCQSECNTKTTGINHKNQADVAKREEQRENKNNRLLRTRCLEYRP
jgi:hypothetical protein